ncbi:rod-binding protein [Planctomicrobium sp. SH668]|uniref:rod-binding protein n=1 Tax=Planctomicrobium sp. SH668 TaxID=3448126 RepID=UPI003F5B443E
MHGISTSFSPAVMPTAFGDNPQALNSQSPQAVAQQFESLFISMLVKELRQSGQMGEGMFPGDGSDTYGGLFDMYLGQHLSESGGIGLADSIQKSIDAGVAG